MEREDRAFLNANNRHVVAPCSAAEIGKALHITRKDERIALEVLHEAFPKKFPTIKIKGRKNRI